MLRDTWTEEGITYYDYGTVVVCGVNRIPLSPYEVDGVLYVEVFATK